MDFTQNKLSKKEWETIEVPVSAAEKQILSMIRDGYHNVNIRSNETQSMYSFIKIEKSPEVEYLLYKKYFEEFVLEMTKKYGKGKPIVTALNMGGELKTLKSADAIRMQNVSCNVELDKPFIFEYLLLDLCYKLLKHLTKNKPEYSFYLYTLMQLKKASINDLNVHVMTVINSVIEYANGITQTSAIITNAYKFIEQNPYLLKYEDRTLFSHQKDLFTICRPITESKQFTPKLILYTAPTGTGKTLSPIGLAANNRIIFVCVARHIGLALAKSAITMEKKVAFAFGCETASDIRLHYFAALNYTKNKRSGGIGKVDNSVGDNVEIMICDVQSYITAMHYMLAFNPAENIITYWDEPTITLDCPEHELHSIIHTNWSKNIIPTMVLSCATLPNADEIYSIFDDFRSKFDGAELHTITSFDCKKSIPILNKDGLCVLPHYMYSKYTDLIKCANYCAANKTLLRYFDLSEIIRFIEYVNKLEYVEEAYRIDAYFSGNITEITMNRLKEYYLDLLIHINEEDWGTIYEHMLTGRKRKYNSAGLSKSKSVEQAPAAKAGASLTRTASVSIPLTNSIIEPTKPVSTNSSGIQITTADAYTLTDGPTIFLADDVNKIGTFYVQQSKISASVFQNILMKISDNTTLLKQIDALEGLITVKESKSGGDDGEKTAVRESGRLCNESQKWMSQINKLRKEIRMVSLDPVYVPNTRPHQQVWAPGGEIRENAFISNIGEEMAKTIMLLEIDNQLKILLLLGIGMFIENQNVQYMEIMKQLADEQRLFIIIASTDYIYGTNYQFCHGFIGKDLTNMTQQKTLQAMGRIGRNNIQQDYTIRFRDDDMIARLFQKQEFNLEAQNMCRLFCSE